MTDATIDFAIIGAGIAGASVAFALAPHASVAILEAEPQPGYHATGRSAALYSETYGNATIRALTKASLGFFERPPRGFSDHPLLTPRGALHVAHTNRARHFDRIAAELSALDPKVEVHDSAFARDRVPILREDGVARCIWEPQAADIDVHALLTGYLRGAREHGASLRVGARVQTIDQSAGVWRVRTDAGEIFARTLVNAAGAWADDVARMAGVRPLGLKPLLRTAILVDGPADQNVALWPFTIDIDETVYFKPDAGKLLVSPCDEDESPACDVSPDELGVAIAVDRLETLTSLKVRRVEHRWAGLRTFAPDRAPVVGFGEMPGFLWLAAQGGYGVQTAPALGRMAAGILTGDSCGDALVALMPALSPNRFQPDATV